MSDDPTFDEDTRVSFDADPDEALRILLNTPADDESEPDEDDD